MTFTFSYDVTQFWSYGYQFCLCREAPPTYMVKDKRDKMLKAKGQRNPFYPFYSFYFFPFAIQYLYFLRYSGTKGLRYFVCNVSAPVSIYKILVLLDIFLW